VSAVWPRGLVVGLLLAAVGCGGGEPERGDGGAESPPGSSVPDAPGTANPPASVPQGRIRVEVLNGGGQAGRARQATERLRDAGFDVVFFGNGPAVERSRVVARLGNAMGAASGVARALGIGEVEVAPDSTRFVEVTVHLGPDWSPAVNLEEDPANPGAPTGG